MRIIVWFHVVNIRHWRLWWDHWPWPAVSEAWNPLSILILYRLTSNHRVPIQVMSTSVLPPAGGWERHQKIILLVHDKFYHGRSKRASIETNTINFLHTFLPQRFNDKWPSQLWSWWRTQVHFFNTLSMFEDSTNYDLSRFLGQFKYESWGWRSVQIHWRKLESSPLRSRKVNPSWRIWHHFNVASFVEVLFKYGIDCIELCIGGIADVSIMNISPPYIACG